MLPERVRWDLLFIRIKYTLFLKISGGNVKVIINDITSIVIAIIIAYLLGSIPFAYIITRIASGKDIRALGSGNGGAHNVYREVGLKVAILVGLGDVVKGAAAVSIAYWLMEIPFRDPDVFVCLSALAAIAGHMWPIYLKFKGGNGLSTTIGSLAIMMPWGLLIVIGLLIVLTLITSNLVLSTNISLFSVPISAWFVDKAWEFVGFSIVAAIMLILHFLPTARAAMTKAGNKENLTNELLRKDKS
jgi:glycerol-3-phosphate acyltransferase PlsY